MEKSAKYNIGDTVIHVSRGYRALIVDIDPLFQASGRYNPAAVRKGFGDRKEPWYRLLVDNSSQMTYVKECCIKPDFQCLPIQNPKIPNYSAHQDIHRYH